MPPGVATLAALLSMVLVMLVPLAHASSPDPTWLSGLYDDHDYDDVIVTVTSCMPGVAAAATPAPTLDVVEAFSELGVGDHAALPSVPTVVVTRGPPSPGALSGSSIAGGFSIPVVVQIEIRWGGVDPVSPAGLVPPAWEMFDGLRCSTRQCADAGRGGRRATGRSAAGDAGWGGVRAEA